MYGSIGMDQARLHEASSRPLLRPSNSSTLSTLVNAGSGASGETGRTAKRIPGAAKIRCILEDCRARGKMRFQSGSDGFCVSSGRREAAKLLSAEFRARAASNP